MANHRQSKAHRKMVESLRAEFGDEILEALHDEEEEDGSQEEEEGGAPQVDGATPDNPASTDPGEGLLQNFGGYNEGPKVCRDTHYAVAGDAVGVVVQGQSQLLNQTQAHPHKVMGSQEEVKTGKRVPMLKRKGVAVVIVVARRRTSSKCPA